MRLAENNPQRADRHFVFFGTTAVSTPSPLRRTNFTWLPFWLASTKPAASSLRLISLKGSGLSRANFNLDRANLWHARGFRGLEMEFQRFFQIGQCLLFALALTGYIDFQALRDEPIAFAPNGRSERSLHAFVLS